MRFQFKWLYLVIGLITALSCSSVLEAIVYRAKLTGVEDQAIYEGMMNASACLSSPTKETSSIHSLKVQAQSQISTLEKVAAYYGYFDPKIEVITHNQAPPLLEIRVDLGRKFLFKALELTWADQDLVNEQYAKQGASFSEGEYCPTLADMPSFRAGEMATGKKIALLDSELVGSLRAHGYAFAKILHKEVLASRGEGTIVIKMSLQSGPVVCFGPTVVTGAARVKPEFFAINQTWKEGALFNPKYLHRTEEDLRESGLFITVQVEETQSADKDWAVPINIIVTENRPRSIGAGVSYTSTYGAGVTGLWEHRNIAGMGQKVSTKLELWQKMRTALFSLTLPNFSQRSQDLLWLLEYDEQTYMPFTSRTVKGSALIDRQINRKSNAVYGVCLQRLESTGIIGHKLYRLVKLPLQYKWSNTNHLLDPTSGGSLHLRLTPSWQVVEPHYAYLIHLTTLATYKSFFEERITLAGKAQIGNIFGSIHNTIPLPDKFFGGTDSSLRGYKTGTVSPTNIHGKLIGGHSIATGSFEARIRQTNGFGYVLFYDIGQVFPHFLPSLHGYRLLQSVGTGLRYTTPIGPLRIDIAFPLQRRHKIDPPFQLYFSIGQAF